MYVCIYVCMYVCMYVCRMAQFMESPLKRPLTPSLARTFLRTTTCRVHGRKYKRAVETPYLPFIPTLLSSYPLSSLGPAFETAWGSPDGDATIVLAADTHLQPAARDHRNIVEQRLPG